MDLHFTRKRQSPFSSLALAAEDIPASPHQPDNDGSDQGKILEVGQFKTVFSETDSLFKNTPHAKKEKKNNNKGSFKASGELIKVQNALSKKEEEIHANCVPGNLFQEM